MSIPKHFKDFMDEVNEASKLGELPPGKWKDQKDRREGAKLAIMQELVPILKFRVDKAKSAAKKSQWREASLFYNDVDGLQQLADTVRKLDWQRSQKIMRDFDMSEIINNSLRKKLLG